MLIFLRPPWASQYADPSTLASAQRSASHLLFFGNVGIFFYLIRVYPSLLFSTNPLLFVLG